MLSVLKLTGTCLAATLIVFCLVSCDKQVTVQQKTETVEVEVLEMTPRDLRITTTLNGIVNAYEIADIRPQVSGIILEQLFTGGENVKKGEPLYQIDPRPFKNSYDYAVAEYQEAKSKLELTELKLKRYNTLSKDKAVSVQSLDDVKLSFAEAEAKRSIKLAAMNNAKLDLEYTRVLSPINGIVGRSKVTRGALVTKNQVDSLTTVADISRVYVDLQQSADEFRKWQRSLKMGRMDTPPEGFKVKLSFSDGDVYEHEGVFRFSEVQVDENSGNLTLRAIFDNPQQELLPGMNVSAAIDSGLMHNVLTLPESAVYRDPKGRTFCYIVSEGKALRQDLTLQPLDTQEYMVIGGINPGDIVITGSKKILRNDMDIVRKEK